jgi:hypothetical protein
MTVIMDQTQIEALQSMVSCMTEDGHNISLEWAKQRGWTVVPVEDASHIPEGDIPRIVTALRTAGTEECFAVATEPLGDLPPCYRVQVTKLGFRQFNLELSPFRFLLTDAKQSWAISCTEDYLLFAGDRQLVEAMLPVKICEAREIFSQYAEDLHSENLREIAVRYAQV